MLLQKVKLKIFTKKLCIFNFLWTYTSRSWQQMVTKLSVHKENISFFRQQTSSIHTIPTQTSRIRISAICTFFRFTGRSDFYSIFIFIQNHTTNHVANIESVCVHTQHFECIHFRISSKNINGAIHHNHRYIKRGQ